jgi:transcriptional regulator with XRE-family HTH domain
MGARLKPAKGTIGRNIRRLRIERGLSATELSERCGLVGSHIAKIERQFVKPTVETLIRIAKGLGVNPSALLKKAKG